MKSRKVLFALVLALVLCLSVSAAMAAANVGSYDELLTAIANNETEINITQDFTVDKELPHEYMDDRPTLAAGTVINGNGKTITVKVLKNYGNGGELFMTDGGCVIKDLTFDASNLEQVDFNVRLLCLTSGDTLQNVTIKGNSKLSIGITTSGSGTVTVKDCDFTDVNGHAIYNSEDGASTLNVSGSTFDDCAYVTIARGNNNVFDGNTVNGGKLNVIGSSTITDNTFNGETRIKFYEQDSSKEFSGNNINDESYIETESVAKDTDLSQNTYENIYTALASDTISDAAKAAAIAAQLAANKPPYSAPRTGDSSNIALWLSLMAISAAAFVVLGKKARFN